MSKAELQAHYLFDTLCLGNIDDEVKRHLMVLLLTMPAKSVSNNDGVNDKKRMALKRLSGCVTLPDDFDYKSFLADALDAKYK